MPARLVPLNDPGAAPLILQRPVLFIGRHPECDVRLDLPQVSRRHCCIALAYDRLTIRDLGSRNGVRVNGEPVDESRLKPGDEVAIAQLLYRLDDPTGSLSAPTPAKPPVSVTPTPTPADLPASPPTNDDLEGDLIPLDDDLFALD